MSPPIASRKTVVDWAAQMALTRSWTGSTSRRMMRLACQWRLRSAEGATTAGAEAGMREIASEGLILDREGLRVLIDGEEVP